jgi:purine-binding chemotaxis protein CheW
MNMETKTADDGLLLASFYLGDALFAIDARQVQEVVKMGEITRVHHAPTDLVGIRNLRGRIVTVIDLRIRLALGRVKTTSESRVLIVETQGEPVGLLVDRVADMVTMSSANIQPAPSNVNGVQGRNLQGVCRNGGRLIALLNLATVLLNESSPGLASARETPPA